MNLDEGNISNKLKLVNLLKSINKTVGIFPKQSKWPLQGNDMAAISKSGSLKNLVKMKKKQNKIKCSRERCRHLVT